MKIYHYDPRNGRFIGSSDADESPLEEGVFMIPACATEIEPPVFDPDTQNCELVVGSWSITPIPASPAPAAPDLEQIKAGQIQALSEACRAQIYAGFQSSALGTAHAYPANDRDQANLSASVLASLLPGITPEWTTPFWCMDQSGEWGFIPHTAAQIQQAGTEAKTAVLAALQKNATLAGQVMAVQSVGGDVESAIAAVQAITW